MLRGRRSPRSDGLRVQADDGGVMLDQGRGDVHDIRTLVSTGPIPVPGGGRTAGRPPTDGDAAPPADDPPPTGPVSGASSSGSHRGSGRSDEPSRGPSGS